MSDYQIDFSQVPPAATVAQARSGFDERAAVVTNYNASRTDQLLAGELFKHELDTTTVVIARLEKLLQAELRGGAVPSVRSFLRTHSSDPEQGLRAYIASRWKGEEVVGYRALIELDDTRAVGQPGFLDQVEGFLLRSQVRSKTGTDSEEPLLRTGEYDVALRGLVTIMYRYGHLLSDAVRHHVLHDLLTLTGGHDPGVERVDFGVISFPETENHLLLMETSRYLTNQLRRSEVGAPGADDPRFDNGSNGLAAWLLGRLQKVLQNDFSEYNARPYQCYSTMAVQNLFDYADDESVRTAAHAVLDYIAAKFAVSSSGLRRAVPFRRRKEFKDQTALFAEDADVQTMRFIILAGSTQRMAEIPGRPFNAPYGARDVMQLAAVSHYRVPDLILDLVVCGPRAAYTQHIRHWGVELYAGSPSFLISAGGIWMESDHGQDEFNGYDDAGWALPITLMPASGGIDRADFIQIKGAVEDHDRVSTGVVPGFACGLNPAKPASLYPQYDEGSWTYIDASPDGEAESRSGFYVAFFSEPATSGSATARAGAGGSFGFFEAVEASTMTFGAFRRAVRDRNGGRTFTSEGVNAYTTVDGRTVTFTPNPPGDKYQWGILDADGNTQDLAGWPLAEGTHLTSDGHTGLVTVDNPGQGRLVLDLRDVGAPTRTETEATHGIPLG